MSDQGRRVVGGEGARFLVIEAFIRLHPQVAVDVDLKSPSLWRRIRAVPNIALEFRSKGTCEA